MDKQKLLSKVKEYNELLKKAEDIFYEDIREVLEKEYGESEVGDILDNIWSMEALFPIVEEDLVKEIEKER